MDKIQELELRIEEYKKIVKDQQIQIDNLELELNSAMAMDKLSERYLSIVEKLINLAGNSY